MEAIKIALTFLSGYTLIGYFIHLLTFFIFNEEKEKTRLGVLSDILTWPALVFCFISIILCKILKYVLLNFPDKIENRIKRW